MHYVLPPATEDLPQVGQLSLQVTPVYLNCTAPLIKYSVRLWGFQTLVPLLPSPEMSTLGEAGTRWGQVFKVTTNLANLTGYFRDMSVLMVVLVDGRTNREIGTGFVKMRTFIVNDLLSDFEENLEILSTSDKGLKKITLGQIKLKISVKVPLKPSISEDMPSNEAYRFTETYLAAPKQYKSHKMMDYHRQAEGKQRQGGLARKLIAQSNVFDDNQDNDKGYKQFTIHKTQKQLKIARFDDEREPSNADAVSILKTRHRIKSEKNLDDFIEEDSLAQYPGIEELTRKYGTNNICVERMKLKLDEAKYLSNKRPVQTAPSSEKPKGHIVSFHNVVNLGPSSKSSSAEDIQVTQLQSERAHMISQTTIKGWEAGLLLKVVEPGNVLQFDVRNMKGKAVIRQANMLGQVVKICLKDKQSGKRMVEFDVLISSVGYEAGNAKKQGQFQPKQAEMMTEKADKAHFYIGIAPELKSMLYDFEIHPQSQKQPAKGRKMIFTASTAPQRVRICMTRGPDQEPQSESVVIDPNIKMREENIGGRKERFKVFLASAEDLESLMKIVVAHEPMGRERGSSGPDHQDKNAHSGGSEVNQSLGRADMLKILVEYFCQLDKATNSECMDLIKKLMSPALTEPQTLSLFQKLASNSECQDPARICRVFLELLHGQFSMFWSCFQQFKNWNSLYHHALSSCSLKLNHKLTQLVLLKMGATYDSFSRKQIKSHLDKIFEKLVSKLLKNKDTLFGLIPYESCLAAMQSYFVSQLNNRDALATVTQQQWNQSLLRQQISKLNQTLSDALTLLCRYAGNTPDVFCLKISELSTFLQPSPQQLPLQLNDHQLTALSHSCEHLQLLLQVVASSVDTQLPQECTRLTCLLDAYSKLPTEQSSQAQDDRRTTENNVYTEEQERLHTEDINNRRNVEIASQSERKETNNSAVRGKMVKVRLQGVVLGEGLGNSLYELDEEGIEITIESSDQKAVKEAFPAADLPKVIALQQMQDYKVRVKLPGPSKSQALEGIFIAQSKLEKIVLYDPESGSLKQVAHIDTGLAGKQTDSRDEQSVVIVEVKNEVTLVKNTQQALQREQAERKLQAQSQNLVRKPQVALITAEHFYLRILSLSPVPRHNQKYLVQVQSPTGSLIYPDEPLAKLANPHHDTLTLRIKSSLGQEWSAQKLTPSLGAHEVCFCHPDGTVKCLLTVQIIEFVQQQQLVSINNSSTQRVLLLNVYHMQSFAKLIPMQPDECLTLVLTTESKSNPVLVRDIEQQPSPLLGRRQALRHVWMGLTARVDYSSRYDVCVYRKTRGRRHNEQDLLAHFEFQVRINQGELGLFEHKGYLIDRKGYRLAINMFEIRYNDIFSRDPVGRQKYENLLAVFTTGNIVQLNQDNPKSTQDLKHLIRNRFGFNNVQLHLLFSLERQQDQLLRAINLYDITSLVHSCSISLHSYSIQDLFTEYEIFDFTNSGIIGQIKAENVDMLVYGRGSEHRLGLGDVLVHGRKGWVHDLGNTESEGNVDYLLMLWCLRLFAVADGFFCLGEEGEVRVEKKQVSETTWVNKDNKQKELASRTNQVTVDLLGYRNLRVEGQPGTLIFYINGKKLAEPVPRCFTHEYTRPARITATYPLTLQIYNRRLGIRQLYNEELVHRGKVYDEKVSALGGEVYFMIGQQSRVETNKKRSNESHELKIDSIDQERSQLNETQVGNLFRQSRRQLWSNLMQSRGRTQKIEEILKSEVKI